MTTTTLTQNGKIEEIIAGLDVQIREDERLCATAVSYGDGDGEAWYRGKIEGLKYAKYLLQVELGQ